MPSHQGDRRADHRRYPETTFAVTRSADPPGIRVLATGDVDDIDEVLDLYLHRLTLLHVKDGLPPFVIPAQTPARLARLLTEHPASS